MQPSRMYTYIAINSLLLSWGSYHWNKFAITKLGVPLLEQVASYSLFLSWGSRCWDRFAIYSFAKLWFPAGTRLIMQPLAGSLLVSMGQWLGTSADISEYFLRIVCSLWGGGASSPYSSLGMKMAFKNWAGMDSFPIHRLTQFKYSQAVLGPTHCFAKFLPEGINAILCI